VAVELRSGPRARHPATQQEAIRELSTPCSRCASGSILTHHGVIVPTRPNNCRATLRGIRKTGAVVVVDINACRRLLDVANHWCKRGKPSGSWARSVIITGWSSEIAQPLHRWRGFSKNERGRRFARCIEEGRAFAAVTKSCDRGNSRPEEKSKTHARSIHYSNRALFDCRVRRYLSDAGPGCMREDMGRPGRQFPSTRFISDVHRAGRDDSFATRT